MHIKAAIQIHLAGKTSLIAFFFSIFFKVLTNKGGVPDASILSRNPFQNFGIKVCSFRCARQCHSIGKFSSHLLTVYLLIC